MFVLLVMAGLSRGKSTEICRGRNKRSHSQVSTRGRVPATYERHLTSTLQTHGPSIQDMDVLSNVRINTNFTARQERGSRQGEILQRVGYTEKRMSRFFKSDSSYS